MQSTGWCFTINNPRNALDVDLDVPCVRYAIFQIETGETGTPHYQGYVEFHRSQRMQFVKDLLGDEAHVEQRRGTREQAREYCRKEEGRVEGPWEIGTWTGGQGTRNDIAAFKARVDAGATDVELWDEFPNNYLRYSKMLNVVRALKQPKRNWKTHVTLLYGPPGCGKSRWVAEQAPDAYYKPANEHWWDGYSGQADVVLDDYKAWLPWSTLLQLLDRYPMSLPVKGAHSNFIARRIFITTNFLPSEWYGKDDGDKYARYPIDALTRRVDSWKAFRRSRIDESQFEELVTDKYDQFLQFVINYQHPASRNPQ